jgi:histidine triad (HIT) family protein
MNCIFCKIAKGEIKKDFEYQDEDLMVFPDINPLKPVHILIVPKKHIKDFFDLNDSNLIMKIKNVINDQVKKNKLNSNGFRVHVNGGGAQVIDHLHFHLTGPIEKGLEL